MFESVVTSVLNRVLANYVTNLEGNQLRLGIWSGDVVLKNLNVRTDALELLGLPILVREGTLKELILKIPWTNLKSQPVKIFINGVDIVAAPNTSYHIDLNADEASNHAAKMEQLKAIESIRMIQPTKTGETQLDEAKEGSFLEQLVTKIVDNMQIKVNNIHLRYEDIESWPNVPFAVGIRLDEARLVSTDQHWREQFVHDAGNTLHKLLDIAGLSVYFADKLQDYTPDGVDFVMKPVTGVAKFVMNRVAGHEQPKLQGTIEFEDFALVVWDLFYGAALRVAAWFQRVMRAKKYRRFRPVDFSRPSTDPIKWWKYAINAIQSEIHERRRRMSWEYFKERRDDRRSYIELHAKELRAELLAPEQVASLKRLEIKLSMEDLLRYRLMARAKVRRERISRDTDDERRRKAPKVQEVAGGAGFLSWIWGGSSEPGAPHESTLTTEELEELEQEKSRLYEAIDFDEKSALQQDSIPQDAVMADISFKLRNGIIGLRKKPKDRFSGEAERHLTLNYSGLGALLCYRKDSSALAKVELESVRVEDGFTRKTLHKTIVRPKPKSTNNGADAFFQATYELYKPERDRTLVGRLDVSSQPLEVILNAGMLAHVKRFLAVDPDIFDSAMKDAMYAAAQGTLEEWSTSTRATLEYALMTHKAIDVNIHIAAPIFVIPESVFDKSCPVLMIDAGQVDLYTDLVPDSKKREIQDRSKDALTGEERAQLEGMMYDRYHLTLSQLQVMICPSFSYCRTYLDEPSNQHDSYHVLDETQLVLDVGLSILPRANDITKVKLVGKLPSMRWHLNDWHYRAGMRILNNLQETLKGLDEEGTPTTPTAHAHSTNTQGDRFLSLPRSQSGAGQRTSSLLRASQRNLRPEQIRGSASPEHVRQTMALNFVIDELSASLSRFEQGSEEANSSFLPLLDVQLRSLGGEMRQYDDGKTTVHLFMRSVSVLDHLKPTGTKYCDLIRPAKENTDLVNVSYVRGPGTPTKIKANLSSLLINFDKDTIHSALEFASSLSDEGLSATQSNKVTPIGSKGGLLNEAPVPVFTNEEETGMELPCEQEKGTAPAYPSADQDFIIDVTMEKVMINIIEKNQVFLALSLGQSETRIRTASTVGNSETFIQGSVGELDLTYCYNLSQKKHLVKSWRVFSIRGKHLAEFEYRSFLPEAKGREDESNYQGKISLKTGAPCFRYNPEMVDDVLQYVDGLQSRFQKGSRSQPRQTAFHRVSKKTFRASAPSGKADSSDGVDTAAAAAALVAEYVESNLDAPENTHDSSSRSGLPRFKIDVKISSPILMIPNPSLFGLRFGDSCDEISVYPGEIVVASEIIRDNQGFLHRYDVSVNKIRLEAAWFAQAGHGQFRRAMKMLEDVDLGIKVRMTESVNSHGPTTVGSNKAQSGKGVQPAVKVDVSLSDVRLRLTDGQYLFIAQWLRLFELKQVQSDFTSAGGRTQRERALDNSSDRTGRSHISVRNQRARKRSASPTRVYPTLAVSLALGMVSLELFTGDMTSVIFDKSASCDPPAEIFKAPAEYSLGDFSIHSIALDVSVKSDASYDAELTVGSFSLRDTRLSEQVGHWRDIITTELEKDEQLQVNIRGGGNLGATTVSVTFDSPKVTVALNFLFAILGFLSRPWRIVSKVRSVSSQHLTASKRRSRDMDICEPDSRGSRPSSLRGNNRLRSVPQTTQRATAAGNTIMKVAIVHPRVILLEDPRKQSTQAVILDMRTAYIRQGPHETHFAVERLEILLSRGLDRYRLGNKHEDPSRVRLLRPVDLSFAMKTNETRNQSSGTADLGFLDIRLSYRDLMMFMAIFNRAVALAQEELQSISTAQQSAVDLIDEAKSMETQAKQQASTSSVKDPLEETLDIVWRGFNFALINDLSEVHVPILRAQGGHVDAQMRNWSSDMKMRGKFRLHAENYNLQDSYWEPLVEPWSGTVDVSRAPSPSNAMTISLDSRNVVNLNVTHAFVGTMLLMSQVFQIPLSDSVSHSTASPHVFVVENMTGCTISLWNERSDSKAGNIKVHQLGENESTPWGFEDFGVMRDRAVPQVHKLCLELSGHGWESLRNLSIDRQGTFVYNLRPRSDHQHQLVLDIKKHKTVMKKVCIRSSLVIVNHTKIPLDIIYVGYRRSRETASRARLNPDHGEISVPIDICYQTEFHLRPEEGFMYDWSERRLSWKGLLEQRKAIVNCPSKEPNRTGFKLCVEAVNDTMNNRVPAAVFEPTRVHLFAPLEIENLLPYEIRFIVRDEMSRMEERGSLGEADCTPLHTFGLDHKLGLSISIPGEGYKTIRMATIYDPEDSYEDDQLSLVDRGGLELYLRLQVQFHPTGGGARRVSVSAPYILVNNLGLDMQFKERSLLERDRLAAGQGNYIGEGRRERPFMFSYSQSMTIKNRALIKAGDSKWSKPCSFDAIGSDFQLSIPCLAGNEEVFLGVSVSEAPGKYRNTKTVKFAPRFIVHNSMAEDLVAAQIGTDRNYGLTAFTRTSLLYFSTTHPKKIRFKLKNLGENALLSPERGWSAAIDIQALGKWHVKLPESDDSFKLLKITVVIEGAVIFVLLEEQRSSWPYRIENHSDYLIHVGQRDTSDSLLIESGATINYAWEDPCVEGPALLLQVSDRSTVVSLSEIGVLPPLSFTLSGSQGSSKEQAAIALEVRADKSVIVLQITDYQESNSVFRRRRKRDMFKSGQNIGAASTTENFELVDVEARTTLTIDIRLASVGISLVDRTNDELVYFSLEDLVLSFTDRLLYTTIKIGVRWFQVDNQMTDAVEPIVVYPTSVPESGCDRVGNAVPPVFQTFLVKSKDSSHGLSYFMQFNTLLQELSISLDEDLLFALVEFARTALSSTLSLPQGDSPSRPDPRTVSQSSGDLKQATNSWRQITQLNDPKIITEETQFYFETFLLQPAVINLSFVRTQRQGKQSFITVDDPFMWVFDVLSMGVANIHDAPIKINALAMEHVIAGSAVLWDRVTRHYTTGVMHQLHKLIGSADVIGNPVGLFNSVTSGVWDLFYEPYQGFVSERPQDVGLGFAKGASNFMRKTVFGLSNTASKITGSASKALTAATFDKDFQQRHQASRARNTPAHAGSGLADGSRSLAKSVASGVRGVLEKPLEGAEQAGVEGFFKGIGKGLVGFVTKPAVGVFDFASQVTEGIRNTTTMFDDKAIQRRRLPRHIDSDGILRPYRHSEAQGAEWLRLVDRGRRSKGTRYVCHLDTLHEDLVCLLSTKAVILARKESLNSLWILDLNNVITADVNKSTIILRLDDGDHRVIPAPDPLSAKSFAKRVGAEIENVCNARDAV